MKKAIVAVIAAIIIAAIGIFAVLHYIYKGTPDSERITSKTDIRLVVNLPGVGSSPSRAITKTYDAEDYNSFSETKKNKIRMETSGRVEGDIPCVYAETKEKSEIEFVFQNSNYNNIKPKIDRIDLYRYIWSNPSEIEPRDVEIPYTNNDGALTVYAVDFVEDRILKNEIENGVFEIRYQYGGKQYVSVTAVNVLEDDKDPFDEDYDDEKES